MKKIIYVTVSIYIGLATVFALNYLPAQDIAADKSAIEDQCCNNMKSKSKSESCNHSKENENIESEKLERDGIIDLTSIDKNNDKMLFQCEMHANVISDEEANCPLCGMKLTEEKESEVRKQLKENGFKVKVE